MPAVHVLTSDSPGGHETASATEHIDLLMVLHEQHRAHHSMAMAHESHGPDLASQAVWVLAHANLNPLKVAEVHLHFAAGNSALPDNHSCRPITA